MTAAVPQGALAFILLLAGALTLVAGLVLVRRCSSSGRA